MSNDRMWLLNEKLGLAARLATHDGLRWVATSEIYDQLDSIFTVTWQAGLDESSLRIVTEGDFSYGDVCKQTGLRNVCDYDKNPLLDKLDLAESEIDLLREQNAKMAKQIDFLKMNLMLRDKHIEKLKTSKRIPASAMMEDEPWPLRDVLSKLIEASEILMHNKNYDGHGWEQIIHAIERGKSALLSWPK